jgi:hypothetical protein
MKRVAVETLCERVATCLFEEAFNQVVAFPQEIRRSVTVLYEYEQEEQCEYEHTGELILEGLFEQKMRHYRAVFLSQLKARSQYLRVRHDQILQSLRLFRQKHLMIRLKDTYDAMKHDSDERYPPFALILAPLLEALRRRQLAAAFRRVRGRQFRVGEFAFLERVIKLIGAGQARAAFRTVLDFGHTAFSLEKASRKWLLNQKKRLMLEGFDAIIKQGRKL